MSEGSVSIKRQTVGPLSSVWLQYLSTFTLTQDGSQLVEVNVWSWAAAKRVLMMIASIWDLFHWGDKYLHTPYLHKTWRNPTADIYWSGALAVWQSVRITTVTKYNKRCSQAWFMSSAQGGRREIRQAEIVTRVWPHRNQSDWFQREDRKTYFQFIT